MALILEGFIPITEEGTTEDMRQSLDFFFFQGSQGGKGLGFGFVFPEGLVRTGSSVLILPAMKVFKPRERPGTKH